MDQNETDEETRPLDQPTRRVVEAYATNDRHNTTSENNTSSTKIAKNLRTKAEIMPELEVRKVQNIVKKLDSDEQYVGLKHKVPLKVTGEDPYLVKNAINNQEDLEEEVEKMFNYIEMAEEDEIDTNNSMLSSAVKTMDDSIKFYLGRVFGYGEDLDDDDDDDLVKDVADDIKLTEDQLDAIAKKISERLEQEAKHELKAKADSVKEEKVKEVKQVLAEDKTNTRAMANDVHEVENVVLEDLKDEIDKAAARVKDSLPEKVKNLRNEVVLEMTGKMLDDIEKTKQAKKEKKQEIVKKFEEIQQQSKIQVAKVELPVGKTDQVVMADGASVEKPAQVANGNASVGKPAKVAKVEGIPVEKTAQVAKLEGRAPDGKINIQLKNVKTLNAMNGSAESDAMTNVRTSTVKAQAPKPISSDRDDIVLGTEESDDTETTSTTSTSYKPDYESALRDAADDDEGS